MAKSSEYEDKESLKRSIREYNESLKFLPLPDAYVGIAYIALLVETTATEYLEKSFRINPFHDDTIKLIEYIK